MPPAARGNETYRTPNRFVVRGSWFANRPPVDPPGARACPGSRAPVPGSRTARPALERAPIPRPGARARRSVAFPSRRTFSGCNCQTSHCPWFVKTWRTSSRLLSAIRAPWQRVSAHRARLVVSGYRPMRRTRLIPARVSFSIFSSWPVVRVCVSARVYVILDNVHWRKGPIDRFRQRFQ